MLNKYSKARIDHFVEIFILRARTQIFEIGGVEF